MVCDLWAWSRLTWLRPNRFKLTICLFILLCFLDICSSRWQAWIERWGSSSSSRVCRRSWKVTIDGVWLSGVTLHETITEMVCYMVAYLVSLGKPGCLSSKYLQQDQIRLISSEADQKVTVTCRSLLHPNLTKKLAKSSMWLEITSNFDTRQGFID